MEFKSPVSKLVSCFHKSRNRWKAKCQQEKRQNKLLSNQNRAVEKSRDRWKGMAKTAQHEIRQLRCEIERLKCSGAPIEHPVGVG
jgi:hypothetical protein